MNRFGWVVLGLTLAAAGCSSSSGERDGGGITSPTGPSRSGPSSTQGNVDVTRVRVFLKDGRVQAFAEGNLGGGCTRLESVSQRRTDNTILITVRSVTEGEVCTMVMQMLREWVPLEGSFEPGDYVLRANQARTEFSLLRGPDGSLQIDPAQGPLP